MTWSKSPKRDRAGTKIECGVGQSRLYRRAELPRLSACGIAPSRALLSLLELPFPSLLKLRVGCRSLLVPLATAPFALQASLRLDLRAHPSFLRVARCDFLVRFQVPDRGESDSPQFVCSSTVRQCGFREPAALCTKSYNICPKLLCLLTERCEYLHSKP